MMSNKKKKQKFYASMLCMMVMISSPIFAGTNSAEITADTLAGLPACLHYEIKGTCFWLNDTGGLVSTLYVQHYLPDVAISVFNKPGDNPWWEINTTLDQAGAVTQHGLVLLLTGLPANGGQHSFQHITEQHVFFKEVDIIGNPTLPELPSFPVLLKSVALPLNPYFQSMLDSVMWRGFPPEALPEQAMALTEDITHTIGTGMTVWGGVFPFEGKVITGNDAKAAAVIAERASQLLTSTNGWGHVYQMLSTNCGTECQAAIIKENDVKTQFQLIYPRLETSCSVFGKSSNYGEDEKISAEGAHVWVLWRQYQGCIPCPNCTFINKIVI